MVMIAKNEVLKNDTVFLDGQRYIACHFINCKLVFNGFDEVDFQDCRFDDCTWIFDSAAGSTLGFLATLYNRTGSDGHGLVESIFETVRSDEITRVRSVEDLDNAEQLALARSA